MFHTQEKRLVRLLQPIECVRDDAWLGNGYYFWEDIQNATMWGNMAKRNTGYFEIYKALIDCENVLDTVFNEEHYRFWLNQIQKVAVEIKQKTGLKATLKQVNSYFKEKGIWNEVTGIYFQDFSNDENATLVYRFVYKKRVQLVVYDLSIITTFGLTTTRSVK